jgi:hypothetical protein
MIKSIAKNVLNAPFVRRRLLQFYVPNKGLKEDEIEACVASGNIWYLSQTKSGTTFTCNVIAFYNAHRYKIEGVDFGNIEEGGVGRGIGRAKTRLRGLLHYRTSTGGKVLVQTHTNLLDCIPEVLLCSTRHPLDFAVSAFYFFYKNRIHNAKVGVDDALPQIVNWFCDAHLAQREAARRSKKVVRIHYESLISEKEKTLRSIIKSIYGTCDETALCVALERASTDRLQNYEIKNGQAIMAPKTRFTEKHFVRSGEIGEGRKFFSKTQILAVNQMLDSAGIPVDGSFDF